MQVLIVSAWAKVRLMWAYRRNTCIPLSEDATGCMAKPKSCDFWIGPSIQPYRVSSTPWLWTNGAERKAFERKLESQNPRLRLGWDGVVQYEEKLLLHCFWSTVRSCSRLFCVFSLQIHLTCVFLKIRFMIQRVIESSTLETFVMNRAHFTTDWG